MSRDLRLHLAWLCAAIVALFTGVWIGGSRDVGSANSADSRHRGADETRSGVGSDDRTLSAIPSRGIPLDRLADETFNTSNPVTSSIAFAELLKGLTPQKAIGIEENFSGTSAQRRVFRYAWGAIDGQGAVDYALEKYGGEKLGRFLMDMLPGWGCGDAATSMAWFDGPGPEEVSVSIRRSGADLDRFGGMLEGQRSLFICGIADQDIDLATDYAYQTTHEGDLGDTLDSIAGKAVRQLGGTGAGAWAEALPDGPHKGVAMAGVARAFANNSPEAAALWIEEYGDRPWAAKSITIVRRELASLRINSD